MKLISMVDFVLTYPKDNSDHIDAYILICNYANFLKQPLTLGMFVPCDLEGDVLEEPLMCNWIRIEDYNKAKNEYQQAKERVLFEGFKYPDRRGGNPTVKNDRLEITFDQYGAFLEPYDSCDGIRLNSIELLQPVFNYLTLTKSAQKQIGL